MYECLFRTKRNLVENNIVAVRAAVVLVLVVATAVESRFNSPLIVIISLRTINGQLKKRCRNLYNIQILKPLSNVELDVGFRSPCSV